MSTRSLKGITKEGRRTLKPKSFAIAVNFRVSVSLERKDDQGPARAADVMPGVPPASRASPSEVNDPRSETHEARYLQTQIRESDALGKATRASLPLQPEHSYLAAVFVGVKTAEYENTGTPAPIPPFIANGPHQFEVYFHDFERSSVEKKSIHLPPFGNSTECEFSFNVPAQCREFRARIVLCHRGRILQAALLRVPVSEIADPERSILSRDIVAPAFGSDETARLFHMTLTLDRFENGDVSGVISTYAPPTDMDVSGVISAYAPPTDRHSGVIVRVSQSTLNTVIAGMAGAIRHHVNTLPGKIALDSPDTQQLLRKFAIHGSTLYEDVILPAKLRGDRPPGWRLSIACSAESYFPAEIVYDRPVPLEDAALCSDFRASLQEGICCGQWKTHGGEVICPLGFWGLSCVIERKCGVQQGTPPPPPDQYELMYRAARLEGGLSMGQPALLATSDAASKVDSRVSADLLTALRETHNQNSGSANDWKKWVQAVARLNPDVLVVLPHHVRDESFLEYLQIGAEIKKDFESHPNYLNSKRVRKQHVLAGVDASPPLVLLIGCETAQARIAFENFVIAFERAGAASVVGTTAPIIGRHAGPVVRLLMNALHDKSAVGRTLGDVLLEAKRKILLEGYPMVMCLATYGGVDHPLQASREPPVED